MTTIRDIEDFRALDPFFGIIERGLEGLVDGGHFFDLLADDVVFEFIITVPDLPAAGRRPRGPDRALPSPRRSRPAWPRDDESDRADSGTRTPEIGRLQEPTQRWQRQRQIVRGGHEVRANFKRPHRGQRERPRRRKRRSPP
jgi:hypothetical protein